ncbi:hypothetical protein AC579_8559 [Pseudocercospora musae]|uniref:Uncharacterized protein n=1 Tax=Pseudocercospora musae TaxID=113226 RepID=A0A139I975_9PEZI|nr:hypothetical protein AC579_8559 [Pseudocercospora musae]
MWFRLADLVEFRGDIVGLSIIVDGNTTDQVFVTKKRPSDEGIHIDLDDEGNILREYVVKKPKPIGTS